MRRGIFKPINSITAKIFEAFLRFSGKLDFSRYLRNHPEEVMLAKKKQKEFIETHFLDENGKVKLSLTSKRPCPICNSESHSVFFETHDGLRYVSCNNCKMVFASPYLTRSAWEDFEKKHEETVIPLAMEKAKDRNVDKDRFQRYIKLIQNYRRKGSLLDIGCFSGNFLQIARKNGYYPYGLEILPKVAEIARKRGFEIFSGDFEGTKIEKKFDIITAWEMIEHAFNPTNVMKKINDILNPRGFLFMSVPHGDSLNSRLLTGHKMDLAALGHSHLFTVKSIKYLLKKSGFRVRKIFTEENHLDAKNIGNFIEGEFQKTGSFHNWDSLSQNGNYNSIAKMLSILNLVFFQGIIERYNLGNLLVIVAEKT